MKNSIKNPYMNCYLTLTFLVLPPLIKCPHFLGVTLERQENIFSFMPGSFILFNPLQWYAQKLSGRNWNHPTCERTWRHSLERKVFSR